VKIISTRGKTINDEKPKQNIEVSNISQEAEDFLNKLSLEQDQ
jgi:hypothetical protein